MGVKLIWMSASRACISVVRTYPCFRLQGSDSRQLMAIRYTMYEVEAGVFPARYQADDLVLGSGEL